MILMILQHIFLEHSHYCHPLVIWFEILLVNFPLISCDFFLFHCELSMIELVMHLEELRSRKEIRIRLKYNRDVVYGKSGISQDFLGGPVVKILSSHCREHRFESLVRKLRSHKLTGVAKKKKRKKIWHFPWGKREIKDSLTICKS